MNIWHSAQCPEGQSCIKWRRHLCWMLHTENRICQGKSHSCCMYLCFLACHNIDCLFHCVQPTRLNVIRNDNDSWDYSKPYLNRRGRNFKSMCPMQTWAMTFTLFGGVWQNPTWGFWLDAVRVLFKRLSVTACSFLLFFSCSLFSQLSLFTLSLSHFDEGEGCISKP